MLEKVPRSLAAVAAAPGRSPPVTDFRDNEQTQRPNPESATGAPAASNGIFLPMEPPGTTELLELILKDRRRLDHLIRDPSLATDLLPRLLGIALAGFALFGVAAAVVVDSFGVWPRLTAIDAVIRSGSPLMIFEPLAGEPLRAWRDGSALRLILAYCIGLIAASGVCLPSLYFYGLLAGVRLSPRDVALHTVKAQATSAVALVGILPVYVAISMGVATLPRIGPLIEATLWLGFLLPFIAGFWGLRSLFVGFTALADTIPAERRCRRECLLRRLLFSWGACSAAVTPVMIYTLWEYFGRV